MATYLQRQVEFSIVVTNPDARPVNVPETGPEHCRVLADAVKISTELTTRSIGETVLFHVGIHTRKFNDFLKLFNRCVELSDAKIKALQSKREAGTLTEGEKSYQAHMRRESGEGQDFTEALVDDTCALMFFPSVDTTGALIAWLILRLSLNPEPQERLYQELKSHCDENDGKLAPKALDSKTFPYLNACLRESHRLNNAGNLVPIREVSAEVEVHGVKFPPGTKFVFDAVSKSLDPTLVEEPSEFRPERWLPDAVEARKGTPAGDLDHPLFSGPFGQGARRCPGSRVATNEIKASIAQMVWIMRSPPHQMLNLAMMWNFSFKPHLYRSCRN